MYSVTISEGNVFDGLRNSIEVDAVYWEELNQLLLIFLDKGYGVAIRKIIEEPNTEQ